LFLYLAITAVIFDRAWDYRLSKNSADLCQIVWK